MDLAEKIREIRKKKGWSQGRLALLAGISQQHVSLIEKGNAKIELRTLQRLLSALGCDLAIQEAPGQTRRLIAERGERLRRFSKREIALAGTDSAAKRLTQVGELVELFRSLHGPVLPEAAALRREALALKSWRGLLAQVPASS